MNRKSCPSHRGSYRCMHVEIVVLLCFGFVLHVLKIFSRDRFFTVLDSNSRLIMSTPPNRNIQPLLDQLSMLPDEKTIEPDTLISHECLLSHETDNCPDGLFISLHTFACLSKPFAEYHHNLKHGSIFLKVRRGSESVASNAGINVAGGFSWRHYGKSFKEEMSFVILPTFEEFQLDELKGIPRLSRFVEAVRRNYFLKFPQWPEDDLRVFDEVLTVDQESRNTNSLKRRMKCHEDGCQIENDLWLNLSDGYVGCGSTQPSNSHSKDHFINSGFLYPLAVKMDSITAAGEGDVFSYNDNQFVIFPRLKSTLHDLKMDLTSRPRTVASIREVEMDWNPRIQMDDYELPPPGCQLKFLCGPGYTGFRNPHNLCYSHAVVQILRELCQPFKAFFYEDQLEQFKNANIANLLLDIPTQTGKVVTSLSSGKYSLVPKTGIPIDMFKNAAACGSALFSTSSGQSVKKYLLYLLDTFEKLGISGLKECFRFDLHVSNVSLDGRNQTHSTETKVELSMDAVCIKHDNQLDQDGRTIITMAHFLNSWFADDEVEMVDPDSKCLVRAKRSYRLKSLPELLIIEIFWQKLPGSKKDFTKLNARFQVDEVVNLGLYSLNGAPANYQVTGMIEQYGQYINDGHAIAYSRQPVQTSPSEHSLAKSRLKSGATEVKGFKWIQFEDFNVSEIINENPQLVPPIIQAEIYFLKKIKEDAQ